jgi:ubiquinol-cytochrome c reductase cytochrome b subunit
VKRPHVARRTSEWVSDRLGSSHFERHALNKVFPDHWSFMLGEVAFYCFLILVATGVFLTVFFDPSHASTVYHGTYAPLNGVPMSKAYASAVGLSFDVRAGLLMRQMHHWAALVFLWAIIAHVCRIFFTGAFRKPRELNWLVGVTLLVLVIANDFLGYSLLDDLLSGTGLRIAYGIVESIPVVGTWMAYLLFGGTFPGTAIIPRIFVAHILIVPLLIFGLLGAHLGMVWRQRHTNYPGPGRRDDNVVGSRLWPVYAAKSIGLFAILAGVVALMGAFLQINPIWLYGPYSPANVTTYAQPDYALGWVEGAMRLFPGWEFTIAGTYRVPAAFWPAVVFPSITFVVLYMWPFLDKVFTGDRAEHHVIDRPRDRPGRSAFGFAVLAFYGILLLAGSQDILASQMNVSMEPVTWMLRIAVIVVPVVVGLVALKFLRDLNRSHEQPEETEPPEEPNEVPPPPLEELEAEPERARVLVFVMASVVEGFAALLEWRQRKAARRAEKLSVRARQE